MTKPRKPRAPITRKFAPAFDLLCNGVPPALVAKTTGYSLRQIYRVMGKPAVKALMISVARDTVARATPKAAIRLTELMAQDDSKKVSLEASTHILGTAGIRPPPASTVPMVQFNVSAGYTLHDGMSNDEVRKLQAEHSGKHMVGYVIDLREPPLAIEHAPGGSQNG